MKKITNKGFVLIPMVLGISFLIIVVFFFVKSKEISLINMNNELYEGTISNVESARQDLLIRIDEGKTITNPKLEILGQEKYDDNTVNEFNVLDEVLGNTSLSNSDKIQFLDRIITQKRKDVEHLNGEDVPDKSNNVFELDLVNFLDNNNVNQGSLNYLTLNYGTSLRNAPNTYILIGRIKKGATIDLEINYEEDLSKKEVGDSFGRYGVSSNDLNNFSFEYVKVVGKTSGSCNITDNDLGVKWCNSARLNDFLSNTDFKLNEYFYKVFLVFGGIDANVSSTPFKISSPSGIFGVGNLSYGDLTLLTPNNTKRRFVIEASSKNSSLPYLIYNLWINGSFDIK